MEEFANHLSFFFFEMKRGRNEDFFERATATSIEKKHELLFNLYLVKMNARPAYLYQCEDDADDVFNVVKNIYTEFRYTIEWLDDDTMQFIYFYIEPLPNKDKYENDEIWTGKVLGFYHCGIPDRFLDRKVIHYYLNVPNIDRKINICSEICPTTDYNDAFFAQKLKTFNECASNAGWTVQMDVEDLVEIEYFLDLMLKNNLETKHMMPVIDLLWGWGVTGCSDNIDAGTYTIEDLFARKHLILFQMLEAIMNPMEMFYPVSRYYFILSFYYC